MKDCVFCQIVNKDIPANIEYEDEELLVFHDIKPLAKVHLLIIPKKHIDSISGLTQNDRSLVGNMIIKASDIAKAKKLESGFRIVTNTGNDAGQVVPHLHFHLLGGNKLGPIA